VDVYCAGRDDFCFVCEFVVGAWSLKRGWMDFVKDLRVRVEEKGAARDGPLTHQRRWRHPRREETCVPYSSSASSRGGHPTADLTDIEFSVVSRYLSYETSVLYPNPLLCMFSAATRPSGWPCYSGPGWDPS